MSRATALACLDALKRFGALIVVFEGGEPLLWRDGSYSFHDLVEYAKRRFARVAVTTNGTVALDVPADVLWVSVDGLKEAHDRLRSGSFDRVWSNLRASRHPRLFVHFTINRENRHDIRPLLNQLREIPAFRGMTVQLFYPDGQGEAPLALSDKERKEALEEVSALKRQGVPILMVAHAFDGLPDIPIHLVVMNRGRITGDLSCQAGEVEEIIRKECEVKERCSSG